MTKVFKVKPFAECDAEEREIWHEECWALLMGEMEKAVEQNREAIENGTFESDLVDVRLDDNGKAIISQKS